MTDFGLSPEIGFSSETSLPDDASGHVILQVGEEQFHTSPATLNGSEMLQRLISKPWNQDEHPDSDKTFFLDADPVVFKYVLRFLRHGVYPLCYDQASGHDYALYTAIYKLSDFLLIPTLTEWLRDQKYLQALKIKTWAHVVEGEDDLSATNDSNLKTQYHPTWRFVKKYVCPRGIGKHYDNPGACGRACKAAQGDAEDEYEDCPVLSTLCVTEQLIFDRGFCIEQ
ncbi:MAG: hypothetical protein Q9216_007015 [Gyalolechia sp. 2 TL-2023]